MNGSNRDRLIQMWFSFPSSSSSAEAFLLGVESQQHYSLLILKLTETHPDLQVKVASSILFKNYVKRNWKLVSEISLSCSKWVKIDDWIQFKIV